jgi:murein L,D-transpeptidase YcbB/YkuD
VKFIFPNKSDVYLHDTPSKSLFGRSRRDFSHGCVRVSNPVGLAEFALKNQGGWTKEKIQRAMGGSAMRRVVLKKSIPVTFFYSTAFFDQNDRLVFYPDVYRHDAKLLMALDKREDVSDMALFKQEEVQPIAPNPETEPTEAITTEAAPAVLPVAVEQQPSSGSTTAQLN